MRIKRIYHADPLLCPRCGGTMKIVAFLQPNQPNIIRKILEHCGFWQERPTRAPPGIPPATHPSPGEILGRTSELDGEFLDYLRHERDDICESPSDF